MAFSSETCPQNTDLFSLFSMYHFIIFRHSFNIDQWTKII